MVLQTYNTIFEADEFARDNGHVDFDKSSFTKVTAQVNGAFSDTDTTIELDTLSGSISDFKVGEYVRIATEYMLITAVGATTITVIRAQFGSIAGALLNADLVTQQDMEQKRRVTLEATQAIEAVHEQPRLENGDLFELDELAVAGEMATIYIQDVDEFRVVATNFRAITQGNYRDSGLSISSASSGILPDEIINEIERVLDQKGIDTGLVRA